MWVKVGPGADATTSKVDETRVGQCAQMSPARWRSGAARWRSGAASRYAESVSVWVFEIALAPSKSVFINGNPELL
jgi:hypothetical protein